MTRIEKARSWQLAAAIFAFVCWTVYLGAPERRYVSLALGLSGSLAWFATTWIACRLRGAPSFFYPPMLVGCAFNAAAVLANGGRMPVFGLGDRHGYYWTPLTPETRVPLLCDIIAIGPATMSVGDVLLLAGFAGMLVSACLGELRRPRVEPVA